MRDSIPRGQITGLLLAGGLGRRMGHLDKGLQPLSDSTLAGVTLQRLKPQVGHLLINANRNLSLYEKFGYPVVQDDIPGHAGPLAGIHAGLQRCKTPYLLSVPCDTPGLPEDLVQRLAFAMKLAAADLALAVTGENNRPELHPVFCLMKISLLPSLDAYLRSGGRKVADWMMQQPHAHAHFSDQTAFMNINTPEDLQTFSSRQRTST
ncbi:MAG: molybdopterin-guanine dinucleotide biosynthesis protein [Pseudomonadota bacterium]|jgi:molybdenum cofactor guanylyltransferase